MLAATAKYARVLCSTGLRKVADERLLKSSFTQPMFPLSASEWAEP